MMSSIFTTFDFTPCTPANNFWPYLWGLLPMMTMKKLYWMTFTSMESSMVTPKTLILNLIKSTNSKFIKGMNPIIMSIFTMLVGSNLFASTPYVLPMSSHLLTGLSMSMPIWLMLVMMSISISTKSTAAHLLPTNSPSAIASFLLLVETLSSLIRPLTLSFRLAANISAGHVIVGLATSGLAFSICKFNIFIMVPFLLTMGYLMFEFAICIIQAYVFTLLTIMYSNDYILK